MEQDRLHVFNHLLYIGVTTCVCHTHHVGPEEGETTLSSGMYRVDTELGYQFYLIFVVPCIMLNSEINPTRSW